MKCLICGSDTKFVFKKKLLQRHLVSYYKCISCDALFTENPYWIKAAYKSAITSSDIGLVSRNLLLARTLVFLSRCGFFNKKKSFLDYAGGYGLLVRLMRDNGFDYYWKDSYCQNIFAKNFSVQKMKYELISAFELFEHFVDPVIEIKKILKFGSSIMFSTMLCDNMSEKELKKWWYICPETGQHLVFYSQKSLRVLADKFGLNLYSDGIGLHLLTDKRYIINPMWMGNMVMKLIDLFTGTNVNVQKDYKLAVKLNRK